MKKKLFVLTSSLVIALSSVQIFSAEEKPDIKIFIDNSPIYLDQEPIIENGRTLVPFRAILESMGVAVEWNAKTQKITCRKKTKVVSLQIGSNKMTVGNKTITLDVPPKIVNNRTLVPLRAVSESFDAKVEWDYDLYQIDITTNTTTQIDINSAKSTNVNTTTELHSLINTISQNRSKLNKDASSEFITLYNQITAFERSVKSMGNITDTDKLAEIGSQYNIYIQKLKNFAAKNKISLN